MAAIQLDASQKAVLDALDTALDTMFTNGAEYPGGTPYLARMTNYNEAINIAGHDYRQAIRDGFRQAFVGLMTCTLTWVAPTLLNSWVNSGAPYAVAAYTKDALGYVRLKGRIQNGTQPATLFTLPAGYRPSETRTFICMSHGASADDIGHIEIDSSGNVTIQSTGKTWLSLDGIAFKAEQ